MQIEIERKTEKDRDVEGDLILTAGRIIMNYLLSVSYVVKNFNRHGFAANKQRSTKKRPKKCQEYWVIILGDMVFHLYPTEDHFSDILCANEFTLIVNILDFYIF